MKKYCINKNAQSNGDHEVHDEYCKHLPSIENQIPLGSFNSCDDAVAKAKNDYPKAKINGCYYCCYPCHTS